jgi:very-short-patch-repair endonuclease
MIDSEREFREEHDLEHRRDWNAYVDAVGEDWLASQEGSIESLAEAAILAEQRRYIQEQQSAPDPAKAAADAPRENRWPYELTPIESKFYDALAETGLTFSVQPWMQHADRKYQAGFIIWYDGRAIVVELDGHDFHKTKDQRGYDNTRANWLIWLSQLS